MCAGWSLVRTSFAGCGGCTGALVWAPAYQGAAQTRRPSWWPAGLLSEWAPSLLTLCSASVASLWGLGTRMECQEMVPVWCGRGEGRVVGGLCQFLDCRLPFPLMLCKTHPSGSIANGCCCQKKAGDLFPRHAAGAWVYLLPQIRCLSLCCRVFFGE